MTINNVDRAPRRRPKQTRAEFGPRRLRLRPALRRGPQFKRAAAVVPRRRGVNNASDLCRYRGRTHARARSMEFH